MIPNDFTTDGNSSQHNTGNKGSVRTIRVGSRSLPLYPLVILCLGLLNTILLLTAIVIGIYCGQASEVAAPDKITVQALIVEVKQLQVMQTDAIKAREEAQQALKEELVSHQQLKLQLEQNKTLSDSIQKQLETLHVEKATLQSDTSDTEGSCGRCLPGWFLANTTCYFHSRSTSDPLKNWHDSRADCVRRGANLTVIDSWEEQLNLFETLPRLDPSIRPWWSKPGGVWFGLTDIHSEGNWVWLNNVTLQGEGYWIPGEPNDYGQREDCAALMIMRNPRAAWFDADCKGDKEWLCEMEPN